MLYTVLRLKCITNHKSVCLRCWFAAQTGCYIKPTCLPYNTLVLPGKKPNGKGIKDLEIPIIPIVPDVHLYYPPYHKIIIILQLLIYVVPFSVSLSVSRLRSQYLPLHSNDVNTPGLA